MQAAVLKGFTTIIALLAPLVLAASAAPGEDIIFVDDDAAPGGSGQSWATAYDDLQVALAAAASGDQVWVADGTYTPANAPDPCDPRTSTFELVDGVAMYGSFAGWETSIEQRDLENYETILSGLVTEATSSCCSEHPEPGCDCPDCEALVCGYLPFCCEEGWDELCVVIASQVCGMTCLTEEVRAFHVLTAFNLQGSITLDGFTVTGGVANGPDEYAREGAGLYFRATSGSATVANCTFIDNEADDDGGGLYFKSYGELTVTDCRFEENHAEASGGGIYAFHGALSLQDSEFTGNTAEDSGGGLSVENSQFVIEDCFFNEQSAWPGSGGAVAAFHGTGVINDCEFRDNWADDGGAIYCENCAVEISQCTFTTRQYDSHDGGAIFNRDSDPVITGCIFDCDYYLPIMASAWRGGAIFNENSSPVIHDCLFIGLRVLRSGGAIYSYLDCYADITDCVFLDNKATDETWSGHIDLYGGAVMHVGGGHLVLERCSFIGNYAGPPEPHWNSDEYGSGGAVFKWGSTTKAEITDCLFVDNAANRWGGAFRNWFGSANLTDCLFIGNDSLFSAGGAIYSNVHEIHVNRCTFDSNSAIWGGAIYENSDDVSTITASTFTGNHCDWGGGAVACSINSSAAFTNCLFSGNTTTEFDGGAVASWFDAAPVFVNCTFAANSANRFGGAFHIGPDTGGHSNSSSATLVNCILWGNSDVNGAGESSQIHLSPDGNFTACIDYSCVQGWTGALGGIGNIGDDPLFVDPDGPDGMIGTRDDDLRLASGSPCIDAADNTALPPAVLFDLLGNPRFIDDPSTPDTGFGDPPIVDMGAYEFQADGCPADVNGDGVVNVTDMLAVIAAWGQSGVPEDINGDGIVDALDLLEVLAAWGPCP